MDYIWMKFKGATYNWKLISFFSKLQFTTYSVCPVAGLLMVSNLSDNWHEPGEAALLILVAIMTN